MQSPGMPQQGQPPPTQIRVVLNTQPQPGPPPQQYGYGAPGYQQQPDQLPSYPAGYGQPNQQGYNQGYPPSPGIPMGQPMGQPYGANQPPLQAYALPGPQPVAGGMYQPPMDLAIMQTRFSRYPGLHFCPQCGSLKPTRVEYEIGMGTWIVGCIICVIGCPLCSCLPCCFDETKDAKHICTSCGSFLGQRNFLDD